MREPKQLGHHPERPVHPDDLPVDVLVGHHGLYHLGVLVGFAEAGGVRHRLGQEVANLRLTCSNKRNYKSTHYYCSVARFCYMFSRQLRLLVG